MKKYFYMFLLCQLLAGEQPSWISRGIELTINNRFDEALSVFSNACRETPGDYRAYFYLAATLDSKMIHYENDSDADKYHEAIDTVIHLVEEKLEENPANKAELIFYLGSAYGYRAYFLGRSGRWYSAFSNGKKATALLNKAVSLDSTIYDAYLGIGTYKYWLYSKLKYFTWLPFIPDEREEGIRMIQKPIKMNAPSKYMAMHQLIYILTDYNRSDDAVIYADTLVNRYPESQFMLWAAAHAFNKNKNYSRAISVYEKLSLLLAKDDNPNPSHVIKCGFKLSELYMRQKQYEACFSECTRVLQRSKSLNIHSKDKELIEALYQLRAASKKEIIAVSDSLN